MIKTMKDKSRVCLIIHGFAGNRAEILYLAKYLRSRGVNTRTVSLAGHGGTKKDLTSSSYRDWINSAAKAVEVLSLTFDKVDLVGFSMGGLICTHLASYPSVGNIVFVNTPVYFWNIKIIVSDIIAGLRSGNFKNIAKYGKSVAGVSLKTAFDFLLILLKSLKRLKFVHNDALILQCRNDESVHFRSAQYLRKKLCNSRLRRYDGGCHQVFDCPELRDRVCGDVYCFLR